MQSTTIRLLLPVLLAAAVVMQPQVAEAGFGHIFCGWVGVYSRDPIVKIIATIIVLTLSYRAATDALNWWFAIIICTPIVVFALGPTILYGMTGEDCEAHPEITNSSTPLTSGQSQGSAAPVVQQEEEAAPSGAQLNIPDRSEPRGAPMPLLMLPQQQEANPDDQAPPARMGDLPQDNVPRGAATPPLR